MEKTRLTPFAKILIVFAILGAVAYGLYKLRGSSLATQETVFGSTTENEKSKDVINIGVVTWGGYAGGQYFNEGFEANSKSRFLKNYGFNVNFKVIDDFDASRDAFKSGDIDLLWATVDAFPTEVAGLAQFEPQVLFQADWSRGGDAIVVNRNIKNVADLRGKKIAVAPMTPSHSFLIWLLNAGDLKMSDVKLVEVPSAIDAADAFKTGNVDAAVVWSPDDQDCVKKVAGSKILENTKNASQIIADVFIAKKEYIDKNKKKLQQLYEGWMIGASELNQSEENKKKAAGILAAGLKMPEDFCLNAINNVRLTTHGDNKNFFQLNSDYKGVTGEELYNNMKMKYDELGYKTANAKSWRMVSNSDLVSNTNLSGPEHNPEEETNFNVASSTDTNKEAISSKNVSISFNTGQFTLDENAKQLIDLQCVPIAKSFANARIRIEGNTDNVGLRESNVALSKKRAQAVVNYLVSEYGMQKDRFIVVGNGPDKPTKGCESNNTEQCKARNRRTDFELVSN